MKQVEQALNEGKAVTLMWMAQKNKSNTMQVLQTKDMDMVRGIVRGAESTVNYVITDGLGIGICR